MFMRQDCSRRSRGVLLARHGVLPVGTHLVFFVAPNVAGPAARLDPLILDRPATQRTSRQRNNLCNNMTKFHADFEILCKIWKHVNSAIVRSR